MIRVPASGCNSRDKRLCQITPLGMKRPSMFLEIFCINEPFCAQAVRYLALVWPFVKVNMRLTRFLVFESLREVSAGDPCAFETPFLVVEFTVGCLLFCCRTRFGFVKLLKYFPVPIQGLRKVWDADLVLCLEAFLLERVDMASELHNMLV